MVKITLLLNRELFNQEKNQMTIICLLVSNSSFITLIILKDNIVSVFCINKNEKKLKKWFSEIEIKISHFSNFLKKKYRVTWLPWNRIRLSWQKMTKMTTNMQKFSGQNKKWLWSNPNFKIGFKKSYWEPQSISLRLQK